MKKLLMTCLLSCIMQLMPLSAILAQSGQWVWMKGSNIDNSLGSYGTKGVSSPTNEPPARYECAYWKDLQGNFWIFGGGINGNLANDLWRFIPSTNEWTWMNGPQYASNQAGNYGTMGIPSPSNFPPALGFGSNCWTDSVGDLWLFGGYNSLQSCLNDVWRYHIPTNEWTWMRGSGNLPNSIIYGPLGVSGPTFDPGGRAEQKSGWVVGNKLWAFGGDNSFDSKADLWSYDILSNNWAWEGGSQSIYYFGSYGIKGVASASNQPCSRCSYTKWKDTQNNLYIFSGWAKTAFADYKLNDVWKFDVNTKQWIWISGSNYMNDTGQIGNYCDSRNDKYPSSRFENGTIQTQNRCMNSFWTFGGIGSTSVFHNDLWIFELNSITWTRLSGQSMTTSLPTSNYGTKGLASAGNMIPPRGGMGMWSDQLGNLWIFGGIGGQSGTYNYLNDLWKFMPDTVCYKIGLVSIGDLLPPDKVLCPGDTIHYPIPANINVSISPSANAFFDTISHMIHIVSSGSYTIIGHGLDTNSPCAYSDTISFEITSFTPPSAAFVVTPTEAVIGSGQFNFINQSSNAISYAWYKDGVFVSNNKDLLQTINEVGEYCFTLVATGECDLKDSVTHCVKVVGDGSVFIPNAFSPNADGKNDYFSPVMNGNVHLKSVLVFNRFGQNVYKYTTNSKGWDGTFNGKECDLGTYFYLVEVINARGEKLVYKGDIALIR